MHSSLLPLSCKSRGFWTRLTPQLLFLLCENCIHEGLIVPGEEVNVLRGGAVNAFTDQAKIKKLVHIFCIFDMQDCFCFVPLILLLFKTCVNNKSKNLSLLEGEDVTRDYHTKLHSFLYSLSSFFSLHDPFSK